MASSGIPREIYIFSIIIFEVFFFFIYLAIGNTFTVIDNNCLNSECTPALEGLDYSNPALNDETSGLLTYVTNGITGAPAWLNIVFVIFTAMLLFLIVIVILHG